MSPYLRQPLSRANDLSRASRISVLKSACHTWKHDYFSLSLSPYPLWLLSSLIVNFFYRLWDMRCPLYLISVKFASIHLFFSLFLKSDNDKGHEHVQKEKRKNNNETNIIKRHLNLVVSYGSLVFFRHINCVVHASEKNRKKKTLIKTDLDKHLSKKINDSKITWRFDDFMSSLSNE